MKVSKRGEVIDVHNQVQTVTVGVACTSAIHMVPNVLVLARPIIPRKETHPKLKSLLRHHPPPKRFELTRLLPLRFVKISIHNLEKKQLRFKLASGRTFYLQLSPQPGQQEDLFPLWVKVVQMLRPPSETPSVLPETIRDIPHEEAPAHKTPSITMFNLDEDKDDKVSIRSVYLASDDLNTDVRARESVGLSFERPLSPQALRYPAITDGRSSDLVSPAASASDDVGIDDPLILPSRQRSDVSVQEEESVDLSASRSAFQETQQDPLPHHILLLGEPEEEEPRSEVPEQIQETLSRSKGNPKPSSLFSTEP
ncbi:hypothetical protein lerEdw1_001151 [Lerista edwardsae]|nr:hypothetical protein lerEdw1_001152 [Lerista edwardsae]KAJ6651051.1 hypothetical protein lerEdw1_001151 [Lerista edwardsae]